MLEKLKKLGGWIVAAAGILAIVKWVRGKRGDTSQYYEKRLKEKQEAEREAIRKEAERRRKIHSIVRPSGGAKHTVNEDLLARIRKRLGEE